MPAEVVFFGELFAFSVPPHLKFQVVQPSSLALVVSLVFLEASRFTTTDCD